MGKFYVCQVCGHIEFGKAPDSCPVCHAPREQYKENANAIVPSANEGKEKHVPQIIVSKECGLIPGACHDAHIKIGSVPHPMQEDHWIQWIDIYVNKVYTSRYQLLPANLQAAVSVHLKDSTTGTLTVVEHCNKHGNWMAEASI